eukprot:CAMPEP_0114623426 /NCGR_PEP_ID=MMETSP0168-20121206/10241_1 /TAXON_ID=95228 ORGANISM="Vannella sp., Strain DIVA3 517/6/12" /NCGR_SAMPLE_ID=MMETSP0168 /ASSEMBLY_ACC=CAM_ASM_000044 /LENGTH=400 /DNA_ID=CAMNT_0001834661 /DNA_START=31 /DNA_END=1233 /DNA_ORIENTATION=+
MSDDHAQLADVCGKTYKEQAIWFLNCFWEEHGEKDAELIWNYVHKCGELDDQNHGDGSGLDEMKAHVFLEAFQETLTVREMRASLRSTGAIGEKERPKAVPLVHYLLFKYQVDWHTLVDASRQGSNKEELEKAQRLLEEVQEAFRQSEARASEARVAHNEAVAREAEAKAREAEAIQSEADAKAREAEAHSAAEQAKAAEAEAEQREQENRAAQAELEAALAEVKAQEDAYNAKTAELERKSEEGGIVSRNRAKNELAQHLGEDPLPLRRAKITAEAAVKNAERATNAAAAAKEAASAARQASEEAAAAATAAREEAEADARAAVAARAQAEEAARAAAEAKAAAEAALDEAAQRLQEAEVYIEEVKSKPGQAFGALWWIDRELHEQKKYLPESRGGIRK